MTNPIIYRVCSENRCILLRGTLCICVYRLLWIHQHIRVDETSRAESSRFERIRDRGVGVARRHRRRRATPTPPPFTLLRAVKRAARNLVDLHLSHLLFGSSDILFVLCLLIVDLFVISGTASVASLARQQTEIFYFRIESLLLHVHVGLPQVNFLFKLNVQVSVFFNFSFSTRIYRSRNHPSRMSDESWFCAFSMGKPVRR